MSAGGWGDVLCGFLEEPGSGSADEGEDGGPAEDVDVGHEGGLLLQEAVHEAEGAWARLCGADAVAEIHGNGGGLLLQHHGGGGEVCADFGLVEGGAADEGGGGHGDADGAADVAEHVEEASGIAHVVSRDGGGAHGGERNKDEAEGEAGEQNGNEQGVGADVEIDGSEDERADGKTEKAGAEQLAGIDA